MALPKLQVSKRDPEERAWTSTNTHLQSVGLFRSAIAGQSFFAGQLAWRRCPQWGRQRSYATVSDKLPESKDETNSQSERSTTSESVSPSTKASSILKDVEPSSSTTNSSLPPGWEDDPDYNISAFSQLPHKHFGFNQHMMVNAEFKEALRQVLWQFKAPIRYAFAYGSGVFSQSPNQSSSSAKPSLHPNPPSAVTRWQSGGGKVIDFIFGVSYTEHWHSLNLQQHRDHYSFLGSLGAGVVTRVQDNIGAGVYFNPYVTVNGTIIKYGVVNLDTIYRDLSEWDTMYLAGRLHKPVKILRDDPRIRLANQINLISAVRTALLMLPSRFTEKDLYTKIAGLSYMGDPRMAFKAEDPAKVSNIVSAQMTNFRQLYLPLIDDLPNVNFNDHACTTSDWAERDDINVDMEQDMDPMRRGNMVRRLPKAFRSKLYKAYQPILEISDKDFATLLKASQDDEAFSRRVGGDFERKIAGASNLDHVVGEVIKKTVKWPTTTQSLKGLLTAGPSNSWKYWQEKRAKGREAKTEKKDAKVEVNKD